MTKFKPDCRSAPGATIQDLLDEKGISVEEFAHTMQLSSQFAKELLKGNLLLSEEIARNLESMFGVPKSFWLRREYHYRNNWEEPPT